MKWTLPLLCLCTITACQYFNSEEPNFNLTVGPGVFNEFKVAYQVADGGYIAAGYSVRNDDPNIAELPYCGYIARISQYGQLEQEIELRLSDFDEINTGLLLNDGHVLLGGHSRSANGDSDNLLIKVNQQGDTLWTYNFGTDQDEEIIAIQEDFNSDIILLSAHGSPAVFTGRESRVGRLMRLQGGKQGDIVPIIPDSVAIGAISDLELLTDSTYLLSGYYHDSLEHTRPAVWIVSNQNITQIDGFEGNGAGKQLMAFTADSFLLVGVEKDGLQPLWYFNLQGAVQKVVLDVGLGSELSDVQRYYGGKHVILWNKSVAQSAYFNGTLQLCHGKGEAEWTQVFSEEKTLMWHDVEVTADSGFLLAGFKDVEGEGSKAYLVKLDKNGILP